MKMQAQTDRISIEYDLAFMTAFHCGTGIREALIDRTVMRNSGGYLYVPGSTLKGVLRERCEQLARFYEPGKQEEREKEERAQSPHDAEAALWGLGKGKPRMVTRIFGSQNRPGRLFFDDAEQTADEIKEYDSQESEGKGKYRDLQVGVYTQVRLDRPTRTAVQGALYSSEFGNSDIPFRGTIQGWLACETIDSGAASSGQSSYTPTYSLLLLLAGLRMIERIGGNKSAGKGHCECAIKRVEINGVEYGEVDWKSWLGQLDALAQYDRAEEE
jgi:CRISPR/Cas system CMR subunit Cmr4 (Cas7 group RAMP superfamily)